ncbi:MAG: hypothetical protein IJJ74_06500 [Eubacterium sp.]|nr:hypothetical protein [Eubacterium sp.]MBR1673710.1 hypothetical protein [Eubacterium sp.]
MKLKRFIAALATGVVLIGSLAACGSKSDDKKKTEATTAATEQQNTASADAFLSYNGVELKLNAAWADVKDKLGSETAPSETITPCDGGDYIQIMHYYNGMVVTTLRDETIVMLSMDMSLEGNDALLNGKIKKGDSLDAVKEALGAPASEDAGMLVYNMGNATVMIYLDDNNTAVTGANLMKAN